MGRWILGVCVLAFAGPVGAEVRPELPPLIQVERNPFQPVFEACTCDDACCVCEELSNTEADRLASPEAHRGLIGVAGSRRSVSAVIHWGDKEHLVTVGSYVLGADYARGPHDPRGTRRYPFRVTRVDRRRVELVHGDRRVRIDADGVHFLP